MSWPAPDPRDRIPTTADAVARTGRPSRRIALGVAAAAVTGALAYGASALAQADGTTTTSPAAQSPTNATPDPTARPADCGPEGGMAGWGGPRGHHGRWGGRGGELTAIDDTTLTVEGRRGSRTITTTDDTRYRRVAPADASALADGARVAVMGRPADDGTVRARVVTILPADEEVPGLPPLPGRDWGWRGGPPPVGSVSDLTAAGFTVTRSDGSTVKVTADADTRYVKVEGITRSDLQVGDRIMVVPDPGTGNAALVTVIAGTPDAGAG